MSELSKVEAKKFPHTNALPTEQEINEWTKRSRKEGICGILNCFNKPIKQCKKCTNYYCQDHLPSHLDLLPDNSDDLDYDSSKEGLDLFMNDDGEPKEPETSNSK